MLKKQKFKCERIKEMENEIKLFENVEFGSVRTIIEDGEVWFVGKDVCEIFGDTNYRRSISRIDEDEKKISNVNTNGGNQNMTLLNESGLYSLLFLMQPQKAKGVSQNESAINERIERLRKFKRWVTHEVLPTIRKTGSYSITKNIPQSFPEALRAYANEVEQRELAEKQRDEAIRTKAWIGSKREATAMQTAAAKTRECNKLKIELDKSKEYASIRAVEKMTKLRFAWRKLRNYCTAKELDMKKVSDPLYGKINTYPNEAWKKVYGINLEYLF